MAWAVLRPPSHRPTASDVILRCGGGEEVASDGRPVQVHEVRKDVTEVHELLRGADEEGLMLPREARLDRQAGLSNSGPCDASQTLTVPSWSERVPFRRSRLRSSILSPSGARRTQCTP